MCDKHMQKVYTVSWDDTKLAILEYLWLEYVYMW